MNAIVKWIAALCVFIVLHSDGGVIASKFGE